MTDVAADNRNGPHPELRLLRFPVNGIFCYAWKWRDVLTEYRREINYVLREAGEAEIYCLLVDAPLRIVGRPELVSVESSGRTVTRAGTTWDIGVTVWEDGSTDDEGLIRFCTPEAFSRRSEDPVGTLKRLMREYRDGMREVYSPAVRRSETVSSPPPAVLGVVAEAVRQEVAPFLEKAQSTVTDALRTAAVQAEEARRVSAEMAVVKKANKTISADVQEAARLLVSEFPHPLGLIYDLRWNHHLSQDGIVAKLSELGIKDCRTKKRVGECLKEILARAKERGIRLSDRITGQEPPADETKGYDEAVGRTVAAEPRTPLEELMDKEDGQGTWASMDRTDQLAMLAAYRRASPDAQEKMREFYGPEFSQEVKNRSN